jgi:Glycosyltransferase family 9 (heptosyltransferase)
VLLRRAVLALRQAGHAVTLFAPEGPSRVLVGAGPAEVGALLASDAGEFAPLYEAATPLPEILRRRLDTFAAAVVYSRNATLAQRLGEVVPAVVPRDPAPAAPARHASLWLADALTELGIEVPAGDLPALTPQWDEADQLAGRLPERFVALHPGSGSKRKNWPAERFAALAEALAPGEAFALIDGPADHDVCARVVTLSPRAVVVRDRPARNLGSFLSHARLFVGNDSGVSHLAAAVGAPTLALFGPTDPAIWGPEAPLARTLRAPGGDLERLEVRTVLDYVSGAWTSSRLMSR